MQNTNEDLIKLLHEAKTNNVSMMNIIEQFKPLIKAYSKKSGWKIDPEDMESFLTLRLIETVQGMKIPSSVGECITYIVTRIKFGFLDMVKKTNCISNAEVSCEYMIESPSYDFPDIVFESIIEVLDARKQEILRLKFKEMLSDQEIAEKLNISRQGVNKQLRKAYHELIPSV